MDTLSTRVKSSPATIALLVIALLAAWALANPVPTAGAQTGDDVVGPPAPTAPVVIGFAKYEGISGESTEQYHPNWTEILTLDWGAERAALGATGLTRRRGPAQVGDLVISFYYEKLSPKLEEKMLKGEIIPNVEIELVGIFGDVHQTYLRYELKNVMVKSFTVNASADTGGYAMATVANTFEEVKVTYTEFDAEGQSKGNVEYEWKVEAGA